MENKMYTQTFTATINYTDANGKVEKKEPITLMVKAKNEYDAKVVLYQIAKNAYLTFGNGSDVLEVGKNV